MEAAAIDTMTTDASVGVAVSDAGWWRSRESLRSYSGFQGYFADRTEVDRLVKALAGSRSVSNQGW
jgi:hypothetical protein